MYFQKSVHPFLPTKKIDPEILSSLKKMIIQCLDRSLVNKNKYYSNEFKEFRTDYLFDLYVDGNPLEYSEYKLDFNKIGDFSKISEWVKYYFENDNFGIILNRAHRFYPPIKSKLLEILQPILKENTYPLSGLNSTIFFGNHEALCNLLSENFSGINAVLLNINMSSRISVWSPSNYNEISNLHGYETPNAMELSNYANKQIEIDSGSIFVKSPQWNIGFSSEDLSLFLVVWIEDIPSDKTFLSHLLANFSGKCIGDNKQEMMATVSNFDNFDVNDKSFVNDLIESIENKNLLENTIEDIIKLEFEEYLNNLKSASGFTGKAFKRSENKIKKDISSLLFFKNQDTKNIVYAKDDYDSILHINGNCIKLKYHPDYNILFERIKTLEKSSLKEYFNGILENFPLEVKERLLMIVWENYGIEIV